MATGPVLLGTISGRSIRAAVAALLLAASPAGPAAAQQDYPSRPMQAVIGFPAGSGADIMCRTFTNRVQEMAGHSIVMVNKPGAFGSLSYAQVASAKPDGYTFLMAGNALMSAGASFVKNLPFDRRSFVPVTSIAETPFIVTVSASSPIKTVSELIAHLKSRPKNRYGTNNPANVVATAYLRSSQGFSAEPVNYKGAADALVDVENGTLDFMIFDGAFVIAHIRSGKLRPLAVTSNYRVKALPEVPTMIEAGFKDYEFNPWWGVYVPAGTPQPVIDKLAGWFSAVARSDEIAKALDPLVLVPIAITAAEMNKRLDADGPIWNDNLKAAGIEPQ